MLIPEIVFVGWVFCFLVSVSLVIFWTSWPGFLAAGMTSGPAGSHSSSWGPVWPLDHQVFSELGGGM